MMQKTMKILVLGLSLLGVSGALAQTASPEFQLEVFRADGTPPATHRLSEGRQTVYEGNGWECIMRSSSPRRGSIGCKRGDSIVRADAVCNNPNRSHAGLAVYDGETLLASFLLKCPE